MYQKYSTQALIVGLRESGESDRVYAIYTKDFGLVQARASAVRAERSRMRYALQNYSRANVSLVKGKRGWRVAGAAPVFGAPVAPVVLHTFARIAELLLRLVAGEEKNEYLFAALIEAHAALSREGSEMAATIEIVCVARMLFALGYLSAEALETAPARRSLDVGGLFATTAYTGKSLLEAETMRDKLLSSINRAIQETHL